MNPGAEFPDERAELAVMLTSPEGVECVCFVDRAGKIRTREAAELFLLGLRLYCHLPLALAYRPEGSPEWQSVGDAPAAKTLAASAPDQVILSPLLLKRSNPPDPP